MPTFQVRCPNCQALFQVADSLLGRETLCRHCHQGFVPAPLEPASRSRSSPWPWVGGAPSATTVPRGGRRPADAAAPGLWQPGDVILDRYEVRELFTGGGRGLVYRVRHRGWNMDLAVKCPRPEYFCSEQDKEDFEQEAEMWVKLGLHPHTVTCYYVRRLGGIPRVFAEYVAGGSLAEWVRSKKLYAGGPAAALGRILDVAIQFAWGLQHAHEQGLVHRDVKPGNVLLTAEGTAKVTDFGMARARGAPAAAPPGAGPDSVLVSGGGMTPAFCSPEQAQGQPVSRKTDIWSWGVSVLALFTGAARWSAGYLAAGVLEDYLERGPAEDGPPPMPPPLADLLRHCFRPDPEARPRDMREVVAVLQQLYPRLSGAPYRREPPQAAKALADSLNNRAVSLHDLNKADEAERLWAEALAADPGHPESTYNLGLTRWRDGRSSGEALLHQLHEVCASHPGEWLPPYLLARVHLEQGGWRAAVETLERVGGAGAGLDEVRTALAAARDRLANTGRLLRHLTGHTDWVSSVCASGDGRRALSGSADGTLKLWDVPAGRCLRTLRGHTEWVTSVCLGADGRLALSGSADRTLRLWDVHAGRCLRTFRGHANWVLAVALSGDGRHALSAGGDGLLQLWEAATGACLHRLAGHDGPVLAVSWDAGARHILSAGRDRTLRLWDVAGGQCLRTFTGHADKVSAAALGADGRLALSGSADRTLKLWDVATGKCLRTFEGHAGGVTAVCLSADGRHALSGSDDRTVKLWGLATGRCLATLAGHTGTVNSVCQSATGRLALSASADRTLALWGLPGDLTAPYVLSRVLPSAAALAAWTDYQRALARARRAASSGNAVRAAWHIRAARSQPGCGRRPEAMRYWSRLYVRLPRKALQGGWEGGTFAEHAGAVTSVCFSADGRHALSGSADRTLRLWEVATGRCLRVFEGHEGGVTAVCLRPDGRHALSGGSDATLRLWDVATGRCLGSYGGQADVITSVALSADGRRALSGSTDGTAQLWDVASGRRLRVLEGHTEPVHSVCLRADGRYALSGGAQFLVRNESERLFTSGQLKLWDTASGRCLPTFEGHTDAVTAVALGADGRHALSGGGQSVIGHNTGRFSQSGQVYLWELATGRRLCTFTGHTDAVTSVCLSVDGRYALSGSTDRTVKLWEAAGGQCLRTFAGHAGAVTAVALSADGRHALSGSTDGTLKLWILDWELEDSPPADWHEGALPYLEMFLALHTPYAARLCGDRKRTVKELMQLPLTRLFRSAPTEEEVAQALTRRGEPSWTENDFQDLLATLGCAGYGWLRPEGVRRKLEQMARSWQGPPLLPST